MIYLKFKLLFLNIFYLKDYFIKIFIKVWMCFIKNKKNAKKF
ncbi:hypothetical protein CLV57_2700 [Mucilaginibacter auburnensis]|uniref:Uncharacterized protein n=1 Tax=Mucilaginibacter auburnensis TaxID=1457233 RepID=A0A2H9VML6_9SPHI|nr:hypothetical protein CLV57_2700 [Mucilaginibacter auburnensis]